MEKKLKVGIILNDYCIQTWRYNILEALVNSDFAEIGLIIKGDSPCILQKNRLSSGYLIQRLHERVDQLIFSNSSGYCREKNCEPLLGRIPELVIKTDNASPSLSLSKEDVIVVREHVLDILVNFGSWTLKGEVFTIPKYGIWSYRMGDEDVVNSVVTGYWEVVRRKQVTSSVLEILNEDSTPGSVIFRAVESTAGYSITVNRNKVYLRASLFIPRIIKGIHNYGDEYLVKLTRRFSKGETSDLTETFRSPSLVIALRNIFISSWLTINQTLKKIFLSDAFSWILLFKIDTVKDAFKNSYESYKILRPQKDKFWADPFVLRRNNRFYIFVEEFIYKKDRAHISVLKLDNSGNITGSEKIIERPYHLSYPFIFDFNGTYYMIPESSQNKTIELYKCISFPSKWEFSKNLMSDISAVDTTLFYHNNKWWLFTSIDESGKSLERSTELFLFFSDDLFSDEWIEHPCNPVVSDIRTARPAGKIFVQDDKIYRPSQDCSQRYGKGFNLNQITVLSESEYAEILISKVEPGWDKRLKGTHTFNSDQDLTVIDAYSYRRRFRF